MRSSQTPEEKKKWPMVFLELLRERRPEYELNRNARGIRTECVLEVPGKWLLSQNTICAKGVYQHGCSLLLSKIVPKTRLHSPFVAGSRFDDNGGIKFDFLEVFPYLPRPSGLHDSHQWRLGTEDIVRKVTANAEEYLAPHYESVLKAAAGRLIALLETASSLELKDPMAKWVGDYAGMRNICLEVRMEDFASGTAAWMAIPDSERYVAIIANNLELFVEYQSDFAPMLAILRSVGQ